MIFKKKYVYIALGALMVSGLTFGKFGADSKIQEVQATAQSITWDFSDDAWQSQLSVMGDPGKDITAKWDITVNGLNFYSTQKNRWNTTYIQLAGKGSKTERVFTFDADYPGTLDITASNTGSSEDLNRNVVVQLEDDDDSIQKESGGYSSNKPETVSFDINSGVQKVYTDSALRIYNIKYSYSTPERTLQSIYIDGKATKLDYKAGETFNPTGLKVMGRYQDDLGDTEITTGIEWLIEPETLSAGTTSVEVIAKVGDFTSEPFTVNNLTVVKAITIPDILPLDFPKTAETGWLNENRVACYFSSSGLMFDNGVNTTTASSTIELRFEEGNYKYIVLGPLTITFNMEGENLASITFVGLNETYAQYAGTYKHAHVVKEVYGKVDSTCLEAGNEIYYECGCGKYFSDELLTQEITNLTAWLAENGDGYIAPKGHNFDGKVTYTWNEETHECTASWKCQRTGCNEIQSELASIENGKVVYVKDTDATTESNEKGHYEATFSILDFKKQSTPANSVEIPDTKLPSKSLSGGAIAGIAAGSVVGVCLITYVAMFFVWKKNEKALKFLKPSFAWINKKIFRK